MSAPINDGGPISSTLHNNEVTVTPHGGLSIRDYYAGQALAGEMSSWTVPIEGREPEIARRCFAIADAMIAEREGRAE